MLWLVIKGASYQIVSCNLHQENGKHQLWIERARGKSIKVKESEKYEDVKELKDAIDFAIKQGYPSFEVE